MLILVLPIIIVLFPVVILFFIVKHWKKEKEISSSWKIVLGLGFVILGAVFIILAMIVSIHGHGVAGIKSATGVVALIPIGIKVNLIGIPLILILEKKIRER